MDDQTADRVRVSARTQPGAWMPLVRLARVLRRRPGDWDEAWRAAVSATRLAPEEPRTHFVVGLLALDRADHRTAVAAFTEVCRLRPDDAAASTNLAVALLSGPGAVPAGYDPSWPVPLEAVDRFRRRLWWAGRFAAVTGFAVALAVGLPRVDDPTSYWSAAFIAVEVAVFVGIAAWLRRRTPAAVRRLLVDILARDLWFAAALGAALLAVLMLQVAIAFALVDTEAAIVAAALAFLALTADTWLQYVRWVLTRLRGPSLPAIGLLVRALTRRPRRLVAVHALDIAAWRLLARMWLVAAPTHILLIGFSFFAPAPVARALGLVATVGGVQAWSRVARHTVLRAPAVFAHLAGRDPLLPVSAACVLAVVPGWAALTVVVGTVPATETVAATTVGLLLSAAGAYLLRALQGWLGLPRRLHSFPPTVEALVPYERLGAA